MGNQESKSNHSEEEERPLAPKARTPSETECSNFDGYLTDDLSEEEDDLSRDGISYVDISEDSSDFDVLSFGKGCSDQEIESEEDYNRNTPDSDSILDNGFSYSKNLDGNMNFDAEESRDSNSSLFAEYGCDEQAVIDTCSDHPSQTPQPASQSLEEPSTPIDLENNKNSVDIQMESEDSAELLSHDDREDVEMDEPCQEDIVVVQQTPEELISLLKKGSSQTDAESRERNPKKTLKEAYPNVSTNLLASLTNLGIPIATLVPFPENYDVTKLLVSTESGHENTACDSDTINEEPIFIFKGGASISGIRNT